MVKALEECYGPAMMPVSFSHRQICLAVVLACVAALGGALVAQYGFGLQPCELCLIQRVPFVLAGLVALISLRWPHRIPSPKQWLAVVALIFAVNSAIAFYHVGVEQKWWASVCASSAPQKVSVADFAAALSKPANTPRCDQPAWEWHGITMAALNIVFSGGLALGIVGLLPSLRRKETP